jgi:GWxTD domain-containing protein
LAYRYSSGLSFIFPDYRTVTAEGDSMRLLYEFQASDLLFVNEDSSASGSYAISYSIYRDMESKAIIDSGIHFFTCVKPSDALFRVKGSIGILAPDSANYFMRIDFSDLNRSQAVTDIVTIDRTGPQPSGHFLLVDANTNAPLIRSYNDQPINIRIIQTSGLNRPVFMRYFKSSFAMADPPFSDDNQPVLSYVADESYLIELNESDPIPLEKPGIYHFQYDTLIAEGYSFFIFNEDFPRLTNVNGLLESIRYLTTREEFSKIASSKNVKAAVDDFWIEKAGNRERARELIKAYYGRVQTANRLFTSYLEGWKSDRGLIFVIFGSPGTVYRGNNNETWLYSQTAGQSTLSFVFEKKKNPFSDNDFMLRRNPYYDIPWYRAVEIWRDGRIYNDSY